MNHDLVFTHPENLAGTFVTMRPGDDLPQKMQQDDQIRMVDSDGGALGMAKPISLWCGQVHQMPASLLELEQNTLHRTYSGAVFGLGKMTGQVVKQDDLVTLVVLEPQASPRTAIGPRVLIARSIPKEPQR